MEKAKKARVYRLTKGRTPLTYTIANKDSKSKSLLVFDEDANDGHGDQRAIRFAPNQKSIYVDEQFGEVRIEPIVFTDGSLAVRHDQVRLREFLDSHPDNIANGGGVFELQDFSKEAQREIELMEIEDKARDMAKSLGIDELKNIIRKIMPSTVDGMEDAQIELEARKFAKRDPHRFLSLVDTVEVALDGTVAEAINRNIIAWAHHKKAMFFSLENNKKRIFAVPEGEDPEASFNEFLKTDEGIEILMKLEEEIEESKKQ